jgi:ABC-type multidrug transport system fused ATPase/permease subunit
VIDILPLPPRRYAVESPAEPLDAPEDEAEADVDVDVDVALPVLPSPPVTSSSNATITWFAPDAETQACTELEAQQREAAVSYLGGAGPKEELPHGRVSGHVYFSYFKGSLGTAGAVARIGLLMAVAGAAQAARLMIDYWILLWAHDSPETASSDHPEAWWATSTGVLLGGTVFLLLMRMLVLLWVNLDASQTLHDTCLARVLHAPMAWFDVTPIGRQLGRLAKDVDMVDTTLPDNLSAVLQQTLSLLGILALATAASYFIVISLIPLAAALYYFQRLFRRAAMQVKRLELASFSPVYSSFASSAHGAASIRAMRLQRQFTAAHRALVDVNSRMVVVYHLLQRWLAYRIDCLAAAYIFAVALVTVIARHHISPSVAGLAVTYSMQMTGLLQYTVRVQIMLEGCMASVERLVKYSEIEQEPAYGTKPEVVERLRAAAELETVLQRQRAPECSAAGVEAGVGPSLAESDDDMSSKHDSRPAPVRRLLAPPIPVSTALTAAAARVHGWPWRGHISLRGVTMGYRPELPTVLRRLSVEIPAGKKVGVVGRTGAGTRYV